MPQLSRLPFSSPMIATSLALTALFGVSRSALANTPHISRPATIATETPQTIGINGARDGSLLLKTDQPGRYIKAPMVDTHVNMKIAGPVIRSTVSQTFENTSDQWVEGIYVFPLPENAAVDQLRIFVGGRLIEGEIQEKQQARRTYETAKQQGRKASLVEQLRPNMFSASVANIGPRESIAIQIEYQDKTEIKHGVASLTFPMTVGPRFSPPPTPVQVADAEGRIIPATLDPVLDRHLISPPVMDPKDEPVEYLRLPVTLDITLDAGFDLAEISSPYHDISVDKFDADSARITLTDGAVPANRDFQLRWKASASDIPQKAIFTETIGDQRYIMSMLSPPQFDTPILETQDTPLPDRPREMIFVIDTSGSMQGTSITQARAALKLGLERLSPQDTFNIIRFSDTHSSLYSSSQRATPEAIDTATRYVSRLIADGGTMMDPALSEAMRPSPNPDRLRQIVFITDGAIGNETQLFARIQDTLGDARLFPVGIGSAPNRFFMSRAAKFGRGTVVMIGKLSEVQTRMAELFSALENPVLTNLQLSFKTNEKIESYPERLPDLYSGEPIITITRLPKTSNPENVTLTGDWVDSQHTDTIRVADATPAKGLGVLWARAKIADLEERRYDRNDASAIDKAILKTALDYHLVSRLTSLVAVDITPSRDVSDPLITQTVPTQLPQGWNFAKVASARSTQFSRQNRARFKGQTVSPKSRQTAPLPGTASPHIFLMLLGGIFMMLGGGFTRLRRRANL